MRTIRDVLSHKENTVIWIDPLDSVFQALKMMHDNDVGALLVMIDENLVGIVSERDYARKVILDHKASKNTKVSEIMTRDVIHVATDATIQECIGLMKDHHIRHLPVLEDGVVEGIISLRDLFLETIDEYTHGHEHGAQGG